MNFLIMLAKSIIMDLLAKLGSWLATLWQRKQQESVNSENSDTLQKDIKEGASDEKIANDAENLLNGSKH